MLLPSVLLITGFILIVIAAKELVSSSAFISKSFNVSPILIGLTIVALGTSAPEIVVSITAALKQKGNLAIGNAVGSNIANIGLVLGLSALIKPIQIQSKTLFREVPVLFIIMTGTYLLLIDGFFSFYDGLLLLLGLSMLLAFLSTIARKGNADPLEDEVDAEIPKTFLYPYWRLLGSLILLPISAQMIVKNAVIIASIMGVSDVVIGLTVVAIGTSLPEVVTSVVSLLKGEEDLAIGGIIGSNMFNLLAVLPFAGLLSPSQVPLLINHRDYPIMIGMSVLLIACSFNKKQSLSRLSGAILLGLYIAYLTLLCMSA